MCEFKTGDLVLARGFYTDGEWMEKVLLYFNINGLPVCQGKDSWRDGTIGSFVCDEIKPIPRYEERIIDPVRMMQWLVDHGYKPTTYAWLKGSEIAFNHEMWELCGKTKRGEWTLHPEWIEKVEIKE